MDKSTVQQCYRPIIARHEFQAQEELAWSLFPTVRETRVSIKVNNSISERRIDNSLTVCHLL